MASLRTLPLAVVGTPLLVMILPVLSMLFLEAALEPALVPALWKPVLSIPEWRGLAMGFPFWEVLKEVPALAN